MTLRNVSIGVRLGAAFAALLSVVLLVAAIGALQIGRVQGNADDLGNNWLPSVEALSNIQGTVDDIRRTSLRHLLESQHDKKQVQRDIISRDIEITLPQRFSAYEKLISSKQEQDMFLSIKKEWNTYLNLLKKQIDLSSSDPAKAEEATALAIGPAGDAFLSLMDSIKRDVELNMDGGHMASKHAEEDYKNSLYLLAGITITAMVLSVVLAWLITRSITTPLTEAVEISKTIADGDLTCVINAEGKDELTILLNSMQNMNEKIKEIIFRVKSCSDSIATGSKEIAAGSLDLSMRTEQQASNLEETAASMEQVTATVRSNAETALQARDVAAQASEAVTGGGRLVSLVVETMQGIEQASQKISDISGVIDGIAFQTNILALNAAVEAARAGENGRGFAVVAAEVRSLAQSSANAAKEIKGLIDENLSKVAHGVEVATSAGVQMGSILGYVKNVDAMINDISHASEEQASGVRQVGEAINQLDQVTQQNAALVEESSAAASNLEQQGALLISIVDSFKVDARSDTSYPAVSSHMPLVIENKRKNIRSYPNHMNKSDAKSNGQWSHF